MSTIEHRGQHPKLSLASADAAAPRLAMVRLLGHLENLAWQRLLSENRKARGKRRRMSTPCAQGNGRQENEVLHRHQQHSWATPFQSPPLHSATSESLIRASLAALRPQLRTLRPERSFVRSFVRRSVPLPSRRDFPGSPKSMGGVYQLETGNAGNLLTEPYGMELVG
ncbi:hypothetical protein N7G274_000364 [Stereocaulon virgatum]|uniref:Uncharacterized protein n=1 Tax=Stereocaulon virgatum TaxID=373712 RepID=A0ABR4AUA3_9LECA